MSDGYYNLNDEPCDQEEWIRLFENRWHEPDGRWRVGLETVTVDDQTYEVSTVWMGLDHRLMDKGPPLIYETMVFPPGENSEVFMERYATRDDAEKGHADTVKQLQRGELLP